jgi:hypothetical protein
MSEHTKDKLARALRDIGEHAMADKAATGYWHDFLSPLATPHIDLVAKLAALRTPAATRLAEAVMNGAFDASPEEAEDWEHTPEGQQLVKVMARLGMVKPRRRH